MTILPKIAGFFSRFFTKEKVYESEKEKKIHEDIMRRRDSAYRELARY